MSAHREFLSSSFRDPSGRLFRESGVLYRSVAQTYQEHFDALMKSGLYAALVERGWLVSHQESPSSHAAALGAYKVIIPEPLPFVSYPHEWSFSQLRDAALLTLDVQLLALQHGMMLKDASAYNVQFRGCQAQFIDTLSFEVVRATPGWPAYRQFCQHFLAPLALMSNVDVEFGRMSILHIDGIPLGLASKLLTRGTYLHLGLLLHIHMHARSQKRFADRVLSSSVRGRDIGLKGLFALTDSLRSAILAQKWYPSKTEWGDYYSKTNYSEAALAHKRRLLQEFSAAVKPRVVWDLGSNVGEFSRPLTSLAEVVVAFDYDPDAIELSYQACRSEKRTNFLPLRLDLANPSPAYGWSGTERASLLQRGPADLVVALALVHHLALSNNVPLSMLAEFFASCAPSLIVEFVPKEDSQVQRLLASRKDVFPNYTQEEFEAAFVRRFSVERKEKIEGSLRTMYLMRARP